MTKAETLEALKLKLSNDIRWAQRALLAIFKNQTADEQVSANVTHDNAMGFCATDSIILTSFANQLAQRGTLSAKQMTVVFRLMPKYARQLMRFYGPAIQKKLEAISPEAVKVSSKPAFANYNLDLLNPNPEALKLLCHDLWVQEQEYKMMAGEL